MIDIIGNIFHDSGFERIETDSFILFYFKDKTSYWVVIETETLDFIKEQDNLFLEAKKAAKYDPAFDKNASLVLLHKVDDDADFNEFKKQILEIEEDPYQFKKQVLIYNESAMKEFDTQLLLYKFKELISNQEIFEEYKDNYTESSWQALLYRTAQKLPFIAIEVEENKNLSSLFQSNQSEIATKGFDEIENRVSEAFGDKSEADIKALTPEKVLDLLLTEEEKDDGTEIK